MRISLEASALFAQLRLLWLVLEVERASGIGSAETANPDRCLWAGGGQVVSVGGEGFSGRGPPPCGARKFPFLRPLARLGGGVSGEAGEPDLRGDLIGNEHPKVEIFST